MTNKELNKCDKCGQLTLDGYALIEYNHSLYCSDCIKRLDGDLIKFKFPQDNNYTYLPLQVNLEKGYYVDNPSPNGEFNGRHWKEYDNFQELYNHWISIEWGYSKHNIPEVILTSFVKENLVLKNPEDTKEDWEFEIIGFKELMINGEFYNTPWDDKPNDNSWFVSWFSLDCMLGREYSKDFAYFECCECGRTICEQNPANGWRGQAMWHNECEQICVKCWQENMLKNGIDFEEWDGDTIPADFFNYDELREHGFTEYTSNVMVGSGYSGYSNPDNFKNMLWDLHKEHPDWKIICDINSQAIGGLGGYCGIWYKEVDKNE